MKKIYVQYTNYYTYKSNNYKYSNRIQISYNSREYLLEYWKIYLKTNIQLNLS